MAKKRIVIIGAGPGGYVAAIRASQLGAEVFLIEKSKVGGTCLNVGCIPTKALLASVEVLSFLRKASDFGVEAGEVKPNFTSMVERKDRIVKRLVEGIEWLLQKDKIELIKGEATIQSPCRVHVKLNNGGDQVLDCDRIILATGSEPAKPESFNFDGKNVITSTEALSLDRIPSHFFIVGGSYIGLEFACIFRELGSEVTVVEMLDRILPTEDREISQKLKTILGQRGVKIIVGERVEKIEAGSSEVRCLISNGEEICSEKILIAVGRKLNVESMQEAGIKKENNFVEVNKRMETNIENIYAVGDIAHSPLLAHKASREGIVAAENACGLESFMDYRVIPSCVYSIPEVASVGLSEEKAKEAGYSIRTAKFPFSASGRAHTLGNTEGFVKIVAEKETDEILGVHILGPYASDLIAEAAVTMKIEGTVKDIEETIHAHPTLAESLMEASHLLHNSPIHI